MQMSAFHTRVTVVTWALLAALSSPAAASQASLEYGGLSIRNTIQWALRTAEQKWYYFVGGVVLLVLLRSYLRR